MDETPSHGNSRAEFDPAVVRRHVRAVTDRPETPNFGILLGPVIEAVGQRSLPAVLSALERTAAARYRAWAQACPAGEREGLLACAAREVEIAERMEKLLPAHDDDRAALDANIPKAREAYAGVFDGLHLHDQWRIQADAERQGAAAWRGLAGQLDGTAIRDELETCARLEEITADHLEGVLGRLQNTE